MNIDEFYKLLKDIETNYGWLNHMKNCGDDNNVRLFKYIDFCLDTRDMQVWRINFRLANDTESFDLDNKESIRTEEIRVGQ